MGLSDDIERAVANVVNAEWSVRNGNVVPGTEDVALGNGAVQLDAVYLYADMAESTRLARDFAPGTAAKVIRSFLDASCRVIRATGGQIRSFDGDRVMAVYVGDSKNSQAAKCGLQINHVVQKIVRPKLEARFPSLKNNGFELTHCVGIASGPALVVRGGVRGHNDLVSVGRAPNVAAKLSDVRNGQYRTYITKEVHDRIEAKVKTTDNKPMWEGPYLREVGGKKISVFRSNWTWKP